MREVLTGVSIGTFVATMARSATQAQLMLFFVNPPLMALSGGFTPIEAMPKWIQPYLSEPDRALRRARQGRDGAGVGAGRRVRAALRTRRDRFGAGWI